MMARLEELLTLVRPRLAMHGGNVTLIGFNPENGIVQVKLEGACHGCPLSKLTLKAGIEALIMGELPEVNAVEAIDEE